ncbi:SDR family NAD(P)-dependent oxidoreductase [Pseudogemmobacter humi]|uniref:Cyclopentanol dehydrogenase n=1 Tax=Pseudogemmobacter humi TaxID=2483812 RepID=A0A3P5X3J8_9RHOB|nr:SDR family oxidoreductase [Pseudogemmobacter humi]VDC22679.1 Cyclopentanol dehydrogenase [Pseudogemmobacter humi]
MGRLSGKKAIFIGAATGIGRVTAAKFVEEGASLVILDINAGAGAASAAEAGAGFVQCDISNEESVAAAIRQAAEQLGGIDILVNNAALQYSGEVTSFDVGLWDRIFAVNTRGVFLACKYAVPYLEKSKAASIVSTASLAGLRGGPGMTAYSATKGAVIAFTTALAMELAPKKIRVNAICPGWVDTPFNGPAIDFMGGTKVQEEVIRQIVPLGRQGVPAEIAPLFVYLASDESIFMTAQSIVIDGGVYN